MTRKLEVELNCVEGEEGYDDKEEKNAKENKVEKRKGLR